MARLGLGRALWVFGVAQAGAIALLRARRRRARRAPRRRALRTLEPISAVARGVDVRRASRRSTRRRGWARPRCSRSSCASATSATARRSTRCSSSLFGLGRTLSGIPAASSPSGSGYSALLRDLHGARDPRVLRPVSGSRRSASATSSRHRAHAGARRLTHRGSERARRAPPSRAVGALAPFSSGEAIGPCAPAPLLARTLPRRNHELTSFASSAALGARCSRPAPRSPAPRHGRSSSGPGHGRAGRLRGLAGRRAASPSAATWSSCRTRIAPNVNLSCVMSAGYTRLLRRLRTRTTCGRSGAGPVQADPGRPVLLRRGAALRAVRGRRPRAVLRNVHPRHTTGTHGYTEDTNTELGVADAARQPARSSIVTPTFQLGAELGVQPVLRGRLRRHDASCAMSLAPFRL